MANADSVKAKLRSLIQQANTATGADDADLTAAVDRLTAGYGGAVTETWQRPSNWPDLSSLGRPEAGVVYLTYDCRETISGANPGRIRLKASVHTLKRGRVENGAFTAVADAVNGETLPTDEGDFVVYQLTNATTGWGFQGDSMYELYDQPCVEVYGSADGNNGSLNEFSTYYGPAPNLRACTLFGNNAMNFNATGAANHDYAVEHLNTEDWADNPEATSLAWTFCSLPRLKHLTLPFTTAKVTNFANMCRGNVSLETLDVSAFDTSAATNMSYMFLGNRRLRQLDLSNFRTGSVTNFASMFQGCFSLHTVDFSGLDTAGAATVPIKMFTDNPCLKNLTVGTIDKDFTFTNCDALSHDSLLNVIAALAETETTRTLTVGSKNLAKLTEAEIAAATEKGWTVV